MELGLTSQLALGDRPGKALKIILIFSSLQFPRGNCGWMWMSVLGAAAL